MSKYMVLWWMSLCILCIVLYIYTKNEMMAYAATICSIMYALNALYVEEETKEKGKFNENR